MEMRITRLRAYRFQCIVKRGLEVAAAPLGAARKKIHLLRATHSNLELEASSRGF